MTDFHLEKIAEKCAAFGAELDGDKVEKLNLYGNLLRKK